MSIDYVGTKGILGETRKVQYPPIEEDTIEYDVFREEILNSIK